MQSMENGLWVPNQSEHHKHRENYIFHVMKIATTYVRCPHFLNEVAPKYISHKYIEETSKPTINVSIVIGALTESLVQ